MIQKDLFSAINRIKIKPKNVLRFATVTRIGQKLNKFLGFSQLISTFSQGFAFICEFVQVANYTFSCLLWAQSGDYALVYVIAFQSEQNKLQSPETPYK